MSRIRISITLPSSVKFAVVGAVGTLLNLAIMVLLVEKAATPTT